MGLTLRQENRTALLGSSMSLGIGSEMSAAKVKKAARNIRPTCLRQDFIGASPSDDACSGKTSSQEESSEESESSEEASEEVTESSEMSAQRVTCRSLTDGVACCWEGSALGESSRELLSWEEREEAEREYERVLAARESLKAFLRA